MNKNYIKSIIVVGFLSFSLVVQSQIINTLAGNGTGGFSGDGGPATAAELASPSAIGIDASGNVYFADYSNQRIRMINSSGVISTFAGNGFSGYSGDGGQATAAELNSAFGVCFDAATGNVYIADGSNNCVRMVNTSGIISTIAGNGTSAFSGDGGPATAAEMSFPEFVVTDNSGNLYIADNGNGSIRMVNSSGIISTIIGNGTQGYSGDGGQATAAQLNSPGGMSIDGSGNIFVADESNNRIRMVNSSGIINTVAGIGTFGYSGDGGQATAAELNVPYDVSVDAYGDLYVADLSNSVIRMIDATGVISTFAGTGTAGFSGDGGAATAAQCQYPSGVHVDLPSGNVYIGDENNNRVRIVTGVPAGVKKVSSVSGNVTIYPNPTSGNCVITGIVPKQTVELYNYTGQKISSTLTESSTMQIDMSSLPSGIYLVRILNKDNSVVSAKRLVKD